MKSVYAKTLVELAEEDPRIVVLEADIAVASGTLAFKDKFPDRFIDVGCAEANMIGIAAGLAVDGKIPFCCTFTPFASGRAYDQTTISIAYANSNVKIVGMAPGITTLLNGGTHMSFLDIAIMRAMPNMIVLSPAGPNELRACVRWMAQNEKPTYMQMIRQMQPSLFAPEHEFRPGRAETIRKGKDVTILSTGYMTQFAVEAASKLADDNVEVDLLHCPCIKPFPAEDVIRSAKKTGCVVTVETQSTIGGLGGAAAEVLSENHPVKIRRLGIPDQFGEVVVEDKYIFDKYGFGPDHIAAACKKISG